MKFFYLLLCFISLESSVTAQNKKLVVIGSSTAAGLAASPADSAWVPRFNNYYKYQLGVLDTVYNLAVSGTTVYSGMPGSYTPPAGRPSPDAARNVTRAVNLLADLTIPANGCIVVNFPTNGYDNFTIPEIMNALQIIYDSATRMGNKCYVTTTQPRMDGNFATSLIKRKLADLKDSIINRFGVARTLNFWDGMFSLADTTMLPAYSAGDNVHFNNAGHRELFNRVVAKNMLDIPAVAATGDYRSNVNPTGLWSDVASWQVYNGSNWVAAPAPPDAASGEITIVGGDSIRINTATTLDQVKVETGGILALFAGATTTFTLNDGPGIDISVDGKLYVSANGILSGVGIVQNNANGLLILRNQGILAVNTTNNGNMNISGTGNIQSSYFVNNSTMNLLDFTLNVNNATLSNYGNLNVLFTGNAYIASTAGNGILINNAGGTLLKTAATGIAQVTSNVAFNNNGNIKGAGQWTFSNIVNNTGVIAPGNSAGTLTVNPAMVNGQPRIIMEIATMGAVAGTNYDLLQFSTINATNANVRGASLQVTDAANDPIGTVYTLLSFPSGTITGPFANVSLSGSLGNLTYGTNAVTVQKLSALPLTWGRFLAKRSNEQVMLQWTTLQESNTNHFIIEHATATKPFTAIGTVPAGGNSAVEQRYSFVHTEPDHSSINFYRLQQVDKDARGSYSVTRAVQFDLNQTTVVSLYPNPVKNILQATVHEKDITILICASNGIELRRAQLLNRLNFIDVSSLPAGMYYVIVFKKQQQIGIQRFIKN